MKTRADVIAAGEVIGLADKDLMLLTIDFMEYFGEVQGVPIMTEYHNWLDEARMIDNPPEPHTPTLKLEEATIDINGFFERSIERARALNTRAMEWYPGEDGCAEKGINHIVVELPAELVTRVGLLLMENSEIKPNMGDCFHVNLGESIFAAYVINSGTFNYIDYKLVLSDDKEFPDPTVPPWYLAVFDRQEFKCPDGETYLFDFVATAVDAP